MSHFGNHVKDDFATTGGHCPFFGLKTHLEVSGILNILLKAIFAIYFDAIFGEGHGLLGDPHVAGKGASVSAKIYLGGAKKKVQGNYGRY